MKRELITAPGYMILTAIGLTIKYLHNKKEL